MTMIFKRQLTEMKVVSYMLAGIVLVFVALVFSELMTDENKVSETVDFNEATRVKGDHHLITAMNIIIFGFAIQFMTLPTYQELEKRTTERYSLASWISTLIYTSLFILIGVVAMLLFGSDLEPDFLLNMAEREGNVSIFCRFSYCIVLAFHIPYFFFSCKEFLLVIYDEVANRSLSTKLEAKLADFYKN